MSIENRVIEISVNQAIPLIQRSLLGYMSRWSKIYIGSTVDPARRWPEHADKGMVKMVLLYQAWSASLAINMERELIDWARRTNFRIEHLNATDGGEGIPIHQRKHYIYILVG